MKKNFVTFQFKIYYLNLKGSQLQFALKNVLGMNTNPSSDLGGQRTEVNFPNL